jgi:hypothetical protein
MKPGKSNPPSGGKLIHNKFNSTFHRRWIVLDHFRQESDPEKYPENPVNPV